MAEALRSLASQTDAELGGRGSVLVLQRRDHVELDGLLGQLTSTTGAAQDEVLTRLCRLVFSHAFAEEVVLWPALRRALPDGEELTLRVEQEHQEINERVSRVEVTPHDDAGRGALVDEVVRLLREDVRDEEDVLLPRLQQAVDVQALRRLGRSWQAVRRSAPTRPHPLVARRPPGNALAGLPLSMIDRSRDVADVVTRRAPAGLAPVGAAVSRVLAAVSAAVERVPVLQRGEDPSTAQGRR